MTPTSTAASLTRTPRVHGAGAAPATITDPGYEDVPALHLDDSGAITAISPAARLLLDYPSELTQGASFLSYVHYKNLYRIIRDLEGVMYYGKTGVVRPVRLRTGSGRWCWCELRLENRLTEHPPVIVARLRAL